MAFVVMLDPGIQGFHVLQMRCTPKLHHQPYQITSCSCSVVLGIVPKHAGQGLYQEVSASAFPNGILIFYSHVCLWACMSQYVQVPVEA